MSGAVKADIRTYQNYVNGQWVNAESGEMSISVGLHCLPTGWLWRR